VGRRRKKNWIAEEQRGKEISTKIASFKKKKKKRNT
jgi:hypothetical protein